MRKLANITNLDDFYRTEEWAALTEKLKQQSHGVCAQCQKTIADWSLLIVHHKIHLTLENMKDPNISLNEKNLEVICLDCHNKEHNRFGYNQQKVFIVYGAPCAGKSTYVKQHKQRGDLIFDIDRIWNAISGQELFDKPNTLNNIVFNIRDLIIDNIKMRNGKWSNAFIIGGYPNKLRREQLAKELKAELVYIKSSKEECLSRLYNDPARVNYQQQWAGYINKYFEDLIE